MNSSHVRTYLGAVAIVAIAVALMWLLGGCGGDAGAAGFGGARGYAYRPIGGGNLFISASPTPPAGYEPVPQNTVVSIEGYPEITMYVHSDGFYYLPIIPAGTQKLVFEGGWGKNALIIPVVANRVTEGGGHSEGGGGGGGGGGSDMVTYTQGGWGAVPHGNNVGTLLVSNFDTVFPDGVRLGYPNGVTFKNAQQITDFLPQGGEPGVWATSPTVPVVDSTAGVFAGQVLAMQLNVSFSLAGVTHSGLAAMHVASGPYKGYTVGDLLVLAQRALGSDPTLTLPTSISVLNDSITKFNENFDNGTMNRGFLQ